MSLVAEPHELNRSFRWQPHAGPFRRITDAQARAYDDDGFFVLEDAIPLDLVDRIIAEIDPIEAALEAAIREAEGSRVFIARADKLTFTVHLAQQSALLHELAGSELFADLCADLIGPDVRFYWDQAVYKKPAPDTTFPWHQDNGYAFIEPQQYLTCWIALDRCHRGERLPDGGARPASARHAWPTGSPRTASSASTTPRAS